MKVEAKNFKGIEYVQVGELPLNQKDYLSKTINQDLYIKIMIDGKIISNCLQYKDYTKWYADVYQSYAESVKQQIAVSNIEIKPDLALNKI